MEEKIKCIINKALEFGFSEAAKVDCSTINLKTEVRDMCAQNTCGQYNKNWSCPPACGSLEQCSNKLGNYSQGIIVQTVGEIEDSFDFESMVEIEKKHTKVYNEFSKYLQDTYGDVLSVGNGTCTLCNECTYPDQACRFPDRRICSMEAYGMLVSEVCKDNNIKYYYGPNKISYSGCYFFN